MRRLTPEAEVLVDSLGAMAEESIADVGVDAAREQEIGLEPDREPSLGSVRDATFEGSGGDVPVRVYRPGAGTVGTVVFFHGGGWVTGTLDAAEGFCRSVAAQAHADVVSVGYRLAPEHRFPAAADDCYDSLTWLEDNGDSVGVDGSRLAVCGSSSGGNLAASAALTARDRGGPRLHAQALVCPALDTRTDRPSHTDPGTGHFLGTRDMEFFWDCYLGEGRAPATDPRAVPMTADDLSGVAPALVVTAECDILQSEGSAYAEGLREAGVEVESSNYTGMFHGFYGFTNDLEDARRCVSHVAGYLATQLKRQGSGS
ncbi:MAG: alpha/beta hydrolase [Acidimicrobiia bacterium]